MDEHVEQLDLNVNDLDSQAVANTIDVRSTRYVGELNISTGGGNDTIDLGRQANGTWPAPTAMTCATRARLT